MTHLTRAHDPAPLAVSRPARHSASPLIARAVLVATVVLAMTLAQFVGQGEAADRAASADPELTLLLRGMAVLKAGLAIGAVCLVAWRLAHPASSRLAAGLIVAAALMAAGPILVWHVAPVVAAALVFHAGLGLLLVLCLLDRSGAQELHAAVAARRRTTKR